MPTTSCPSREDIAPVTDAPAPQLLTGRVIGTEPLRLDNQALARRAVSCLIQPEPGDSVLYLSAAGLPATILAVLERPDFDAALVLDTLRPLRLQSPELQALCGKARLVAEEAQCHVGLLRRVARRIDEAADYVASCFGSVFMQAQRSIRRVEQLDHTQAGHLRLESASLTELHGTVTTLTADQLVKVSAAQIHMG